MKHQETFREVSTYNTGPNSYCSNNHIFLLPHCWAIVSSSDTNAFISNLAVFFQCKTLVRHMYYVAIHNKFMAWMGPLCCSWAEFWCWINLFLFIYHQQKISCSIQHFYKNNASLVFEMDGSQSLQPILGIVFFFYISTCWLHFPAWELTVLVVSPIAFICLWQEQEEILKI